MREELKAELVDAVKVATAVLNDDDALAIVEICRKATDREIADISERCLAESIRKGDAE